MTAHWTVIASGPTGRRIGVSDMVGTVITANTAIGHVPVDRVDYALFGHSTNVVRGAHPKIFVECLDAGVKLISCRTPIVNTGDPTPTPWHDQVEMIPHSEAVKPSKWCSGSYTKLRDPCGVVCAQYAIAHGGTYLALYGFEGWYLT